jgi:DNA repair exonuclease SbcCD ATPase subunit
MNEIKILTKELDDENAKLKEIEDKINNLDETNQQNYGWDVCSKEFKLLDEKLKIDEKIGQLKTKIERLKFLDGTSIEKVNDINEIIVPYEKQLANIKNYIDTHEGKVDEDETPINEHGCLYQQYLYFKDTFYENYKRCNDHLVLSDESHCRTFHIRMQKVIKVMEGIGHFFTFSELKLLYS